jgi:prephenate dehydrogenase
MDIPFSSVGIVGVGLIGGSLGLAIKEVEPAVQIVGIGRDKTRLLLAQKMGAADSFGVGLESLRDCDLVILATPVGQIIETLKIIGGFLKPGAIVTDVGSTKRLICSTAWSCLPAGVEFIGGHPVAGREVAGVENSLAGLFEDAPYVLCPRPDAPSQSLRKLESLVANLRARVCIMTPDEHDQAIAWVSHLPQLLSTTLANVVGMRRTDISGSGLRDMLRLAASPYSIWQGVFDTNRDNIGLALEDFIKRLDQVRNLLRSGSLSHEFDRANQIQKKNR